MKIKLEMESIGYKLSESGLGMFLRRLDQNLWSQVVPSIFAKMGKNHAKWHVLVISTKLHQSVKCVPETF